MNQDTIIDAMKTVYGPFDQLTDKEAVKWYPPSEPGAGGHRGRYLWTDAFGVINFITLAKENTSPKYMILAKRLAQTVHDVLGRTRDGTARLGDATDDEPLTGGLRIGKMSASGDDGDGQYHHYLTIWMFALNRLSVASNEASYNDLAIELAKSTHPRFFVHDLTSGMRMVWKISMDMSQVLVSSQGHLDAATGFVIYRLLQDTAAQQSRPKDCLRREIDDYLGIMGNKDDLHPSGDLLDLGMGLWIAHVYPEDEWAVEFKEEAMSAAKTLLDPNASTLSRPASRRLAFRELGTCIGVQCFDDYDASLQMRMNHLLDFWKVHVASDVDEQLRPISQVMYATACMPGGKF